MDGRQVLSVGNCGFDHRSLQTLIERQFDARVVQAHGLDDSLSLLAGQKWDLVLVNRQFDRGGDGLELIRRIKADPQHDEMPVMLISNYDEYQQQAVAEGAVWGFGKSMLDSDQTRTLLSPYLATGERPSDTLS